MLNKGSNKQFLSPISYNLQIAFTSIFAHAFTGTVKKTKTYYSTYVHTNKWTAYSILDLITREKKKRLFPSLTPVIEAFKGKEAKQIFILAIVNPLSFSQIQWKVSMSRTWEFHVFIQSDAAINTHEYKMKIGASFMYKRFTLENLHCAESTKMDVYIMLKEGPGSWIYSYLRAQ